MKDFELKATKIEHVEFLNKLPPNVKIELSNKYSYNVAYSKLNTCSGEFKAEIFDKNSPDRFRIDVLMKGLFVFSPEVPKEKLHVMTYDALFPYMKAFVTSLTANSNIPPVYLPYLDISGQSIYRVEMPGKIKRQEDEE